MEEQWRVKVEVPGGVLFVSFRFDEGRHLFHEIYLEGPVRVVFQGSMDCDSLLNNNSDNNNVNDNNLRK